MDAGNDTIGTVEMTEEEQGGCGAVLSGVGVFSILGLTVLLLLKKEGIVRYLICV